MTRKTVVFMGVALLFGSLVFSQEKTSKESTAPEIVVFASDLSEKALSEFDFWEDSASPNGKMVGTPNTGDELDPPPENDPNVTFKVSVQKGVPYRCWIHMKVGAPKGKSQANRFYVQFSNAQDKSGKEVFKPRSRSYLTAQGSQKQGWEWVGCNMANADSSGPVMIYFNTSGAVTVRLQGGMEGVGFDQFILSPVQFLDKPPVDAVVKK